MADEDGQVETIEDIRKFIEDTFVFKMAPKSSETIPKLPDCSVRIHRLSQKIIEKLTRKVVKRPRGRPRKEKKPESGTSGEAGPDFTQQPLHTFPCSVNSEPPLCVVGVPGKCEKWYDVQMMNMFLVR